MLLVGRWARNIVITALLLWVLMAASGTLIPFLAGLVLDGRQLAFASYDGNWDIYVTDTRSGMAFNLTRSDDDEFYFAWSPDGRRIAYESICEGVHGICLMNIGGGQVRRLAAGGRLPSWSPDSQQVTFTVYRSIYITDVESGRTRQLSANMDFARAAWSPDGTVILGESYRNEGELYLIPVSCGDLPNGCDREGIINLTSSPAEDFDAVWSPDGRRIVFTSSRDGNREIYVMESNGSRVRRLTYHEASDVRPAWSPDATQVIFLREDPFSGLMHVYSIDPACVELPEGCAGQERLFVREAVLNSSPLWSPDGQWLALKWVGSDMSEQVYLASRDGSSFHQLTEHNARSGPTQWRP